MIRFRIPDMTCGGCAQAIRAAIESVDPQAGVDADVAGKTVAITSGADREALAAAIRAAGYAAEPG